MQHAAETQNATNGTGDSRHVSGSERLRRDIDSQLSKSRRRQQAYCDQWWPIRKMGLIATDLPSASNGIHFGKRSSIPGILVTIR